MAPQSTTTNGFSARGLRWTISVRHELLAGAALALDEHVDVARRDLLEQREELAHRHARARRAARTRGIIGTTACPAGATARTRTTESPSASVASAGRSASRMRTPSRRVPLSEPQSRTRQAPSSRTRRQWKRETAGSCEHEVVRRVRADAAEVPVVEHRARRGLARLALDGQRQARDGDGVDELPHGGDALLVTLEHGRRAVRRVSGEERGGLRARCPGCRSRGGWCAAARRAGSTAEPPGWPPARGEDDGRTGGLGGVGCGGGMGRRGLLTLPQSMHPWGLARPSRASAPGHRRRERRGAVLGGRVRGVRRGEGMRTRGRGLGEPEWSSARGRAHAGRGRGRGRSAGAGAARARARRGRRRRRGRGRGAHHRRSRLRGDGDARPIHTRRQRGASNGSVAVASMRAPAPPGAAAAAIAASSESEVIPRPAMAPSVARASRPRRGLRRRSGRAAPRAQRLGPHAVAHGGPAHDARNDGKRGAPRRASRAAPATGPTAWASRCAGASFPCAPPGRASHPRRHRPRTEANVRTGRARERTAPESKCSPDMRESPEQGKCRSRRASRPPCFAG